MGLFKKLTDPSPGGGKSGDEPESMPNGYDPREQVRSTMAAREEAAGGKIVDATAVIMGGVAAAGRIDSIKRAAQEINLQDTFDVSLTVFPAGGEAFTARVIQPVAEQYVEAAEAGRDLKVKYSEDDRSQVWIDWAGSANL
ncbi:MAG: hypothetical protein ACPHCI_09990 [Solirubrobacterales bacterium]